MEIKKNSKTIVYRIMSWVVTLLVPVFLALLAVRLVMTPLFLGIEYRTPGFPEDSYGFTLKDRFHLSKIAVDYLLNAEDISYLGDLTFEDGSPLYNQRELYHMEDVKMVTGHALNVWYLSMIGLILLGVWAKFGSWWEEYKQGLRRGGWLTIFLIGTIILSVFLSFGVIFVGFHNIFFESGTWTFQFSDTLIRLFPERFWRDTFLAVGLIAFVGGLVFIFGFKPGEKE